MIVAHNLAAMNTNRMFQINENKKAKLAEKLSSGYKINRSADDAAGLAISEKLRRQIRGLTQASQNAAEGISLIQVADGAMNELHAMMQRGTELCVKAANETLTDDDKRYIQMEINQIITEVDKLSERADFNGIKVLQGEGIPFTNIPGTDLAIAGTLPDWIAPGAASAAAGYMAEEYTTTETYNFPDGSTTTYDLTHDATTLDFSKLDDPTLTQDEKDEFLNELYGNGFYMTCCTCDNHYSISFANSAASTKSSSGSHHIYTVGIAGVTSSAELLQRVMDATSYDGTDGNPLGHFTQLATDTTNGTLTLYDIRSNANDPSDGTGTWDPSWKHQSFNVTANSVRGKFGEGVAYDMNDIDALLSNQDIVLQIGTG